MMHVDEYQLRAARTLLEELDGAFSENDIFIAWNAIGLAGEAGEVAEHVKKGVFHRHGVDKAKLAKELGDVLWYVAALCTKLGVHMSDVMEQNIKKLEARYPDGYSAEASKGWQTTR